MKDFNAYWISPTGAIIGVPVIHITEIIKAPEKFGLTKEKIENIYNRFNEPVGHEGKAREEIMFDLIQKGWIRARYLPRNDIWTMECNRLSNKAKDNIWNFFATITGEISNLIEQILLKEFASKYSDVRIVELKSQESAVAHKTSIKDILSFAGLFEGTIIISNPRIITLIENYDHSNNFEKVLTKLEE